MKKYFLITVALLFMSAGAKAQITVGATNEPQEFSLLEIVSDGTNGLRLPQFNFCDQEKLTTKLQDLSDQAEKDAAKGLQIFNTCTKCVETWNGTKWIKQCIDYPDCIEMPGINDCRDQGDNCMCIPRVRFMKYNLGADPQFDTPKKQIKYLATCIDDSVGRIFGGRFQWGRRWNKTDNSTSYPISVDGKYTLYYGTVLHWFQGQSDDPDDEYCYVGTTSGDWRVTRDDALWGNGKGLSPDGTEDKGGVLYDGNYYQNTDWAKPANNPCPSGFRVPTQDEWERIGDYDCDPSSNGGRFDTYTYAHPAIKSGLTWIPVKGGIVSADWGFVQGKYGGYAIYRAADWKKATDPGGYFHGVDWSNTNLRIYDAGAPEPLLFLPAAGLRSNDSYANVYSSGENGYYWSSTFNTNIYAHLLEINSNIVYPDNIDERAMSFSIRCVAE
ncbi:MAG: fibrobacter succinogenes major paralogous domain-containing protein [Dysgonamonadaceae bacterium]|jgi:hypothetical protein|nr:fibrobacter succinogenes major paralogous domain-containing protein [Dysgonamonadaceae bacterium]